MSTHSPAKSRNVPYLAANALVSLSVLIFTAWGPNAEIGLWAAATLFFGLSLVWRTGESPVLAFIFVFLWLQASVTVLQATAAGETVRTFSERGGLQDEAIALSLAAILALALGLRIGAGAVRADVADAVRRLCLSKTTPQWLKLYGLFALSGVVAGLVGLAAPSLSQLTLPITNLRWVVLYIILIRAFELKLGSTQALWLIGLELMLGLGGFFADFKTVFILIICAMLSISARVNAKSLLAGLAAASLALALGSAWSAIKVEYRTFVSGGTNQQIVVVPYEERLTKLMDLAGQIDAEGLGEGFDLLLRRTSYVDFFGLTIRRVPSSIPYENGALTLDAFSRPLMPRAFFPEKTIIDDSVRTRLYSGARVAGTNEGTSISLGWPAELYVDFGPVWMMAAASVLGLFFGTLYRVFVSPPGRAGAWGLGIATILLLPAAALETSLAKSIGGLVASALVGIVMQRWIVPKISGSSLQGLPPGNVSFKPGKSADGGAGGLTVRGLSTVDDVQKSSRRLS